MQESQARLGHGTQAEKTASLNKLSIVCPLKGLPPTSLKTPNYIHKFLESQYGWSEQKFLQTYVRNVLSSSNRDALDPCHGVSWLCWHAYQKLFVAAGLSWRKKF